MKSPRRKTVALALALTLAVAAFVVLADSRAAAWFPWLANRFQSGDPGAQPGQTSPAQTISTEKDACDMALAAVIEANIGKTGLIGGRILEIAFDDDVRDAYAEYACTLAPLQDGSRWLVTLPVIVRTTSSVYRTSYLVKIGATDGSILDLSRAAGYRRMV